MNLKVAFLAASLAAALAAPAAAQWVHDEDGSAFDDAKTNIAIVAVGQYGFGFRCTEASDLTAVMIAPEAMDEGTVSAINASSPELLLRVDKNTPHELQAVIESNGDTISVLSLITPELAAEVRDGKLGISVAIRAMGKIFHEKEQSLANSTDAISKLMKGCGIAE